MFPCIGLAYYSPKARPIGALLALFGSLGLQSEILVELHHNYDCIGDGVKLIAACDHFQFRTGVICNAVAIASIDRKAVSCPAYECHG